MLAGVRNVYTPENMDEAINLLTEYDVRPLYGGVAIHRESPHEITAVVDLSRLGLEQHRVFDKGFSLGSMMTLEAARQACLAMSEHIPNAAFLAKIIRLEAPINMRNTMTIGDLLVERRSNSILMTALVLLDAQVDANGWPRFIHDWLKAPALEVKSALIIEIAVEQGSLAGRHAFEKVSRTPADAPIVGVMSYVERNSDGTILDARLAVCGVADYPIPLPAVDEELISTNGDLDQALSKLNVSPKGDHWGSTDYRTAMTRVLSRRVLSQTL
jgi:CO/xanthine dehydrogenase FAD-binding subunit